MSSAPLVALLGLMLAGCNAMTPPAPQASGSNATLIVTPSVTSGRLVQARVTPKTVAHVEVLEIRPWVQVSPGVFQAIDKLTGRATDSIDPEVLLTHRMASPSIDLASPIAFEKLRANTTYRIVGTAYGAGNVLLSAPDKSYVDLTLANDDRPTMGKLSIQLADTPFKGKAIVTLTWTPGKTFDTTTTELVKLVDGAEVPLTTPLISTIRGEAPSILYFEDLAPDTSYRLKARVTSNGNEVATGSVDVAIADDDAPISKTLSLIIP